MTFNLRRSTLWLLVVVLVLIAIRAALPHAIKWYVNNELDKAENYDGQIGDVDLHLYRGAYEIEDIRIVKTDSNVPTPLFQAERLDLSVRWGAIFRGALVGEIWMVKPQVNIVDSELDEDKQTGEEESWQEIVQELFPLRIDEFVVEQGEIHFRNFTSDPPVDIYLQNVYARLSNFTNSRDLSDTLTTTFEMTAMPMSQGDLDVRASFDPYTEQPQFELNAQMTNFKVSTMNDFLQAYANLDVEAGTMDLALELAADQGRITGYIKPVINELEVFDWKKDVREDDDGVLQALWEGVAGFVSAIFTNRPEDTFATRVPIDGEIENPETGILNAVFAVVRHAFLEAIQPTLEGNVELEDVREQSDSGSSEDSDSGDDSARSEESNKGELKETESKENE